jgi:hypothetical protein
MVDLFEGNVVSGDKDGLNICTANMTAMFNYASVIGTPIVGTSDCLPLLSHKVDFIYVDADHSYEWCMRDLKNSLKAVSKGGIIAGHDYHPNTFGVWNAVNEFCKNTGLEIFALSNDKLPSFMIRVE